MKVRVVFELWPPRPEDWGNYSKVCEFSRAPDNGDSLYHGETYLGRVTSIGHGVTAGDAWELSALACAPNTMDAKTYLDAGFVKVGDAFHV